jgi:nitrate/nitrite-specific signal transduction histidine kinase
VVGAIGLDYPLTYVDEVQAQVREQLFPVLGLSYAVLLVLVLMLATALARPLKRLTVATERIAEGDYDVDLSRVSRTRFPDEMATLAASFQVMADQVAQRERSLTQEVTRLKVEIDHARREEAVREITETDFFADLSAKAVQMRRRRRGDDVDA